MYLVVGATGIVGSEICRLLTAAGKPARAMVRETSDKSKTEKLSQLDAVKIFEQPVARSLKCRACQ